MVMQSYDKDRFPYPDFMVEDVVYLFREDPRVFSIRTTYKLKVVSIDRTKRQVTLEI